MVKGCSATEHRIRMKLEEELERLRQATGMGHGLSVKWVPEGGSKLSGEVRGDVVYIYEEREAEALETLKHEFIDHSISKEVVKPLVEYVNMQKNLIENMVYKRKEELVNKLARLI